MIVSQRRNAIIEILEKFEEPVSATAFAHKFSVSRQIVVGDVALLRAEGHQIIATPRGYILQKPQTPATDGFVGTIAVKHSMSEIEKEFFTILDFGGTIMDVTVEHQIYGQLVGALNINSRFDAINFCEQLTKHNYKPLSNLTDGIHLHTIKCPNKETFLLVKAALKNEGILYESK